MRLYTIEYEAKEQVAVEQGGRMIPLDRMGVMVKDMNDLIRRYDEWKDKLTAGCADRELPGLKEGSFRILAPIPVPLQDVICLGANYRDHLEETIDVLDFRNKVDAIYFSKRVNRCNDPFGKIPLHECVDSVDYEAELGVIIGKDALGVSVESAGDYIFGYTIVNDVSARNLQFKHKQWYRGKSLDGYTPMGPCIVTADEIENAHDLAVACFVNGEQRQCSNTSLMLTSVEEAISELSQGMTLQAGTVIATGTPSGVALGMDTPVYLKKDDVVCCEISGIGKLINTVG